MVEKRGMWHMYIGVLMGGDDSQYNERYQWQLATVFFLKRARR